MKNASRGYMQQANYQKQALARQTTCSQRRHYFYKDEKNSTVEDRKDHSMAKV